MAIIEVEDLHKEYGSVIAVNSLSFQVQAGEIFGIVGPNGAGKTTTLECLEGMRAPDRGRISVLGMDPRSPLLQERIGVQLQSSALPDRLRVGEAMKLFSSFYRHPVDWQSLLERLGLGDRRNAFFGKLSGGQKQRLFIALALLNDPDLVFFDELTTGLDPQARHATWDLVRGIRDRGKTVVLTTHLMEEAERLCDRIAIVDLGRLVALDSPQRLIAGRGVDGRVRFSANGEFTPQMLEGLWGVSRVERHGEEVTVYGRGPRLVVDVVNVLAAKDVPFRDLRTEQPTLEDAFLALTGRKVRG